ncbi:MFS-type transporter [Mycobacteroides abscessus subsp. abscessus]|nr:MFS-type transporter [Mycobacteroides abscessus subsp. abscessus]
MGVATSGVTFFRTIGSSFGAAIFGSLFSNFLTRELSSVNTPPEATQSPQALHALPHDAAVPVIHAYADSLDLVFLCAAPVAAVGFVLALFLKEVPLRGADTSLAVDMGEGFGMPNSVSPDKLLEIAIGNAMRGFPHVGLHKLREHAGVSMPIAPLWALVQANRFLRATGSAEVSRIAQWYRIPPEIVDPAFNELVANGYALRTNDHIWLTDSGREEVDKISEAINQYLIERLSRTPDFEDRADREQIQAALERISRRIVTDTDWRENPIAALPAASGAASPAR